MDTMHLLIAGFGGQGVLFAGKFLAYAGLLGERQLSWLPSYGPEMRGGTANCSVIISDRPVGSPIVSEPDCLIVMNLPSFQKYQPQVRPEGTILFDSTLIGEAPSRTDVRVFAVPATHMAAEAGLEGLANMVLMGKFLRECMPEMTELQEQALCKTIPPKKAQLIDANRQALALGYNFEG
ncbi:MAG: 2-oxoacid:acceptor oxidoreductase family protein [Clostridiaceae bacterium]|nr:2-oxoacid:acceptor oxidoreductase family protein [Clostridiaceae bacterium]